jgi:NADH-quinone oxidoreductase subunit C
MTQSLEILAARIRERFGERLSPGRTHAGQLTVEVPAAQALEVFRTLRDDPELDFAQLVDVAGVDYLEYGRAEWETSEETTTSGYSRGVQAGVFVEPTPDRPRFAVAYQLLSLGRNQRLRVRVYAKGDPPRVESVVEIWPSAAWFEREAFDLFGILFEGHPDLRRILTDYGFVGHPFRKDFPLIGEVEMRYDPDRRRVVYEPVSIEPRTLVPKVIRPNEGPDDGEAAA